MNDEKADKSAKEDVMYSIQRTLLHIFIDTSMMKSDCSIVKKYNNDPIVF